jgi:hypothetical protein
MCPAFALAPNCLDVMGAALLVAEIGADMAAFGGRCRSIKAGFKLV